MDQGLPAEACRVQVGEVGKGIRRQTQREALEEVGVGCALRSPDLGQDRVTGVEGTLAANTDRQAFPMLTDFPRSLLEQVMVQLTLRDPFFLLKSAAGTSARPKLTGHACPTAGPQEIWAWI